MNISVLGSGRWGSFIAWYLNRIGNNINQIARKCNESGVGPSNETMRLLINYIEESKAELLKGE